MSDQFTISLPKATEKMLIARYDNMLQKAVENEEYELAAYLRDKIKEREVSS